MAKKKAGKKKKARRKLIKGAWTKGETSLLARLFPNTSTVVVAKELGRGHDAVKRKASRMRLRKSKRYMKSIGRA